MVDSNVISLLDPFYAACMHLRKHNYDNCVESCTTILTKNPYDQVMQFWNENHIKYMILLSK